MQRCIQLAKLGIGSVSPNPMVGAVLVYQGRIIGEGYHQQYGQAHAEVNCINSVKEEDQQLISKSTLYVSLEPCSHFGKTPPCADLIVRMHIPIVKIGIIDINQKVHGKGVKKLQDAGIDVTTGICEADCFQLNKRFFTFHAEKRPYIILKWAQSVNGKIAEENKRTAISNQYSNRLVHKWRSEEDAILIGHYTANIDNPLLNNRLWSGKSPVRIILCGTNPPDNLDMFSLNRQKTLVFNTEKEMESEAVSYIGVDPTNYLKEVLNYLYEKQIQSVLVEGGTTTLQSFFEAGLWDECRIITNTKMTITAGISAPELPQMQILKEEKLMNDIVRYYTRPDQKRS